MSGSREDERRSRKSLFDSLGKSVSSNAGEYEVVNSNMKIADPMISGMQVPIPDAGLFLGDSPMTGQQTGPWVVYSYFSRGSPYHTFKSDDQQGVPDALPTNSKGRVGCGSRGVIDEARLDVVGAVAVNVGPRWKGGWVQISISLQVRGSWGNSVRRLVEIVNVRGERVKALGLSGSSERCDVVCACRYARGTRSKSSSVCWLRACLTRVCC